jgi:hypothetical protein
MKRRILAVLFAASVALNVNAQDVKTKDVPPRVKDELKHRYPAAKTVSWEKEDGGYEANWGGRSGEENSVLFTARGRFIQIAKAIAVIELPKSAKDYVATHYKGKKITEAASITTADNAHQYEAEVSGKDLLFDDKGQFLKKD